MFRKAIITGISGQDGFYLTKLLLSKGYEVVGVRRRRANPTTADRRVEQMRDTIPNFHLMDGDVTDLSSILRVVTTFQPNEFYHLAAMSHVGKSWEMAGTTIDITGVGAYNCLEAVRRGAPNCRFYFAGSSEQFGNTGSGSVLLNENSPMLPESPYAVAKVMGYHMSQVYRRSYNMFVSCGVLFNHESPIRGEEFVTRKITSQLARIKHGLQNTISLGNMDAKRDWGFAGDFVEAMWLMLQHDEPGDFVIATGENHSVREFFDIACTYYDLDPVEILNVDQSLMRPQDVRDLLGNSEKARRVLGWEPRVGFNQLVQNMCAFDMYAQHPNASIATTSEDML